MRKSFLFLLYVVILSSCQHEVIIPRKDMANILVKVFLIDAATQSSPSKMNLYNKDSIDYYSAAIESYGYTLVQFDSSISYYTKHPKELDAIFDKVIIQLSRKETKLNEGIASGQEKNNAGTDSTQNLWPLKSTWDIPIDGNDNHINFSIPLKGFGKYTISADVQIHPDDESEEPRMTAYFYFDDKTPSGKLGQITHQYFQKDGIVRNIKIELELKEDIFTHFTGAILDNGNSNGKVKKHVTVSNIRITYKPIPVKKAIKDLKRIPVPETKVRNPE